MIVAPSILSADFSRLAEEARLMESAGADWLHVDVMDGHFVPNITIGPVVVKWLKKATKLPLDVHLMITDPLTYAAPFADAGAWGLTFHLEAVKDPKSVIAAIKKLGVKPGISIKPKTPASAVLPYLKEVHLVLVMTVEPGFGGQSFMADMLPKIQEISTYIKANKLDCLVEVDGGIDPKTGAQTVQAGAQALVAGHSIFSAPDPVAVVKSLKSLRNP
ncbi:MAG: ribulose-phosphate 3-epimerase [Elusimicrobia bacterium]|nr:ribulose-phosphate 3-epimerase [Candidatus Obscuribacterium magneticum]MCB4756374.1 ribulose-phosphate 3-epimerase [Candidatus Obscuribacterium magneticum]